MKWLNMQFAGGEIWKQSVNKLKEPMQIIQSDIFTFLLQFADQNFCLLFPGVDSENVTKTVFKSNSEIQKEKT